MPTCNKNRGGNASSGNSENPPSDGQAAPHKAHARPHRLAHLEERAYNADIKNSSEIKDLLSNQCNFTHTKKIIQAFTYRIYGASAALLPCKTISF